ncbi:ATP-binding protein [Bacillus sp. PS06]|uniref:ATP-binding protein n=1 Tax=Bacillus sp. PS06 TaxID=2764176 RepID=UPI001781779C|nr:ATP-binding protein [Bacillus sp. PS06]MBD8070855.1 two-component sensor histidine kinase [Bacillus sp. PS06]
MKEHRLCYFHVWMIVGGGFLLANLLIIYMISDLPLVRTWLICFSLLFFCLFSCLFLSLYKKKEKGSQAEFIEKNDDLIRRSENLSVIGELAAGIAHEIRNPLTSLKGFLQLIEHGGTNELTRKSYSKVMLNEIERINEIVGELLLLSKPKKMELKFTNLRNILDSVVFLLNTQAILYNIQIHLISPLKENHVKIYCDETKIKQVFINLIKNCIESMENGGNIEITVNAIDDKVCIEVSDQGVGIPKEKLESIGKAFYSTKANGTGLGLMVSHRIINDHGGEIEIDSLVNKGTNVKVWLPIAK